MKAFLCLSTKPINGLSVWSHADKLINEPLFMDVAQLSHSGPHWNKRQKKKTFIHCMKQSYHSFS